MKTDPIVTQVIEKFQQRSLIGISKYGTTLQDNDTDDFLTHLQEELMDAILYIQKLKSIKEKQTLQYPLTPSEMTTEAPSFKLTLLNTHTNGRNSSSTT